jgi:hypothetical protein
MRRGGDGPKVPLQDRVAAMVVLGRKRIYFWISGLGERIISFMNSVILARIPCDL